MVIMELKKKHIFTAQRGKNRETRLTSGSVSVLSSKLRKQTKIADTREQAK